jgi:hypothetical protein
MAPGTEATFAIGHPAPHRGRVGLGTLMLALLGAPAAWSLQHLALYAVASLACSGELQGAAQAWLSWVLPLINLAALLAAALATALAVRILRRTGGEHADRAGGMMYAGEGRTRFLAIWGIWIGVVFMLAIAFNTLSVFWAGLCNG